MEYVESDWKGKNEESPAVIRDNATSLIKIRAYRYPTTNPRLRDGKARFDYPM